MAMTSDTLDVLIVYDIDTKTKDGRRRWRAICQMCKNRGQRVQFSVFECRLSRAEFEELEADAVATVDVEEDSLRFYVLRGGREGALHAYGIDRYRDFDDPLVL